MEFTVNPNQNSIDYSLEIKNFNIYKIINQRYPFIFIDKIKAFEKGKSIHGIKNITQTCPYYITETGTLPLFVIVELMGQLSEVLLRLSFDLAERRGFLAGVQSFEINNSNIPYDILSIKNEILINTVDMYKTKSTIFTNNHLLCQGVFIHVFRK